MGRPARNDRRLRDLSMPVDDIPENVIPAPALEEIQRLQRVTESAYEEAKQLVKKGVHSSVLQRIPRIRLADFFDVLGRGLWSEKVDEMLAIHISRPLETSIQAILKTIREEPVVAEEMTNDQYGQLMLAPSKNLLPQLRSVLAMYIEDLKTARQQVIDRIGSVRTLIARCAKEARLAITSEQRAFDLDSELNTLIRETDSMIEAGGRKVFNSDKRIEDQLLLLETKQDQLAAETQRVDRLCEDYGTSDSQLRREREELQNTYSQWTQQAHTCTVCCDLLELCNVDFWRFTNTDQSAIADPRNSSAWNDAMNSLPDRLPNRRVLHALSVVEYVKERLLGLTGANQTEVAEVEQEAVPAKKVNVFHLAVCSCGFASISCSQVPTLRELWEALEAADLTFGVDYRTFEEIICHQELHRSFLMAGIGSYKVKPEVLRQANTEGWHREFCDDFGDRLNASLRPAKGVAPSVERKPETAVRKSTSSALPSPKPMMTKSPAIEAPAKPGIPGSKNLPKSFEQLEPWQLAVVVYDLICKDDYKDLRTLHGTYRDILVPTGYTFGLSKEEFKTAGMLAQEKQFLTSTKKFRSKWNFFGPTAFGRQYSARLQHLLPANFVTCMKQGQDKAREMKRERHEAWRQRKPPEK